MMLLVSVLALVPFLVFVLPSVHKVNAQSPVIQETYKQCFETVKPFDCIVTLSSSVTVGNYLVIGLTTNNGSQTCSDLCYVTSYGASGIGGYYSEAYSGGVPILHAGIATDYGYLYIADSGVASSIDNSGVTMRLDIHGGTSLYDMTIYVSEVAGLDVTNAAGSSETGFGRVYNVSTTIPYDASNALFFGAVADDFAYSLTANAAFTTLGNPIIGETAQYASFSNVVGSSDTHPTNIDVNGSIGAPASWEEAAAGFGLIPLTAGDITPANPTIDSGQSVTLAANPSGGNPPYIYQWFTGQNCISPIDFATSSTYDASPTVTTTYYYQVTDSASTTACSAGDTVTVNPVIPAFPFPFAIPVVLVITGLIYLVMRRRLQGGRTVPLQQQIDSNSS